MSVSSILRTVLDPGTIWGAALYACAFVVSASVAARLLRVAAERGVLHSSRHTVERTTARFLVQIGQAGIYVVAAVLYCHLIPALRGLGTALLTGASVISVVIGVAAQATLGNLVAGVAILLYRPFRIGDRVQVGLSGTPVVGIVKDLTLGYTVLSADDGGNVVVPNSLMASQAFRSFTGSDQRTLASVVLPLPAGVDATHVRDALLAFTREHHLVHDATAAVSPSAPTVVVRAWCVSADAARRVEADVSEHARTLLHNAAAAASSTSAAPPTGVRS